uniref:Uncharacterized protein n=1 Tax=Trichuris muris TaxID=70415 RepID=A0A5S6QA72_TRIMR
MRKGLFSACKVVMYTQCQSMQELVRNINQEKVVHIMHYKSEWQQIRFSVDEKGEFRLPDWFISEFT